MAKETTQGDVLDQVRIKEPPMWDVLLLNDDVTTMDFVVMVLMHVFFHTAEQAETIMWNIHNNGQGLAGTYTRDIAASKQAKVAAMAHRAGFPLQTRLVEH